MNSDNEPASAITPRGPDSDEPDRGESASGTTGNTSTNNRRSPQSVGKVDDRPREIGGRDGPDPVRYGDWEKNGRCIDF